MGVLLEGGGGVLRTVQRSLREHRTGVDLDVVQAESFTHLIFGCGGGLLATTTSLLGGVWLSAPL